MDDKVALVDTVYTPFANEMIERIKGIVDPAKIDYIVVIIDAYLSWTKNETKRKAVIVYETMWQATQIMARRIAAAFGSYGWTGWAVKYMPDENEIRNCYEFGTNLASKL